MATFNKFQCFVENLAEQVHKLDTNVLKIYLSNVQPVNTNTIKANIAEITAEHGYGAGGTQVNITASAQTGGVYKLVGDDVVFTAVGGTIGPFQFAILYNDTSSSPADPLIGWWDYGAPVTLNAGETFTVDLDQVNGILTLT